VIGEDFNAIRNRREKNEFLFDSNNTLHFNTWIDAFVLQNFKCSERKYT
jgi:hypothetical protein